MRMRSRPATGFEPARITESPAALSPARAGIERGFSAPTWRYANAWAIHATPAVLMIALALAGCASLGNARHIATVSIVTAHSVLSTIQDTEVQVVCGRPTAPAAPQCIPQQKHQDISKKFVQAFDYDGKIARLVRATPDGAPSSAEVVDLLGKLQALVSSILADLPSSPKVNALTASLEGAR